MSDDELRIGARMWLGVAAAIGSGTRRLSFTADEVSALCSRLLELLPPADDGEPLTDAFLSAEGGVSDGAFWLFDCALPGVTLLVPGDPQAVGSYPKPARVGRVIVATEHTRGTPIAPPGSLLTRGDFRRVRAVLGKPQEEPPK